jgi:hypothetical protein
MMVLDLQCANEHFFEGWFSNSVVFNQQKKAGEIRCPVCEDNRISQVLSPVAIKRTPRFSSEAEHTDPTALQIQHFYNYIAENFEEVGTDFAKEALKMHYGVSDKKNIRGTSTEEEEKILKEEGVEFLKIPFPKREH